MPGRLQGVTSLMSSIGQARLLEGPGEFQVATIWPHKVTAVLNRFPLCILLLFIAGSVCTRLHSDVLHNREET